MLQHGVCVCVRDKEIHQPIMARDGVPAEDAVPRRRGSSLASSCGSLAGGDGRPSISGPESFLSVEGKILRNDLSVR